jgi:hypothetical protein
MSTKYSSPLIFASSLLSLDMIVMDSANWCLLTHWLNGNAEFCFFGLSSPLCFLLFYFLGCDYVIYLLAKSRAKIAESSTYVYSSWVNQMSVIVSIFDILNMMHANKFSVLFAVNISWFFVTLKALEKLFRMIPESQVVIRIDGKNAVETIRQASKLSLILTWDGSLISVLPLVLSWYSTGSHTCSSRGTGIYISG